MTPHDDLPRDAWLSEALRHAPDADAAPPAELSETILRQARNAVKTAAPPRSTHPLWQAWSWLARPPIAAGFATLMVATLVGVMWWDKPLDDALPRAEAPATASDNAAAAPAQVPAAAPALEPGKVRDEAKASERVEKETPRAAAKRVAVPPAAPAQKREQAPEVATPAIVAEEPRARAADAAAPMATAPAPARESAVESRVAPSQSLGKVAAAPAPAPAAGLSLRRQEIDTVTPLAEQPERWTWQRGGDTQPMRPALQSWLAQLDRTARWRPADTAAPPVDALVLLLSRDGTRQATIQLGDDTVWLTRAGGSPLMASLPPATAATLKAALLAATP